MTVSALALSKLPPGRRSAIRAQLRRHGIVPATVYQRRRVAKAVSAWANACKLRRHLARLMAHI